MISCEAFRARFEPATEEPVLLEHVRACDLCLPIAAERDPDILFRALGGEGLVPPGGVDAFVEEVMREVRLRAAEDVVVPHRPFGWTRRLAVAATIAAAVTGSVFLVRHQPVAVPQPMSIQRAALHPVAPTVSKPVVESYASDKATIVEVPTDGSDDVKVVMVFDETLPADL